MSRPSWIEVDLDAIAHNVRTLADLADPAALCVAVKADGYGHGDVPVAETALANGATWLAVASIEEGRRLREAGIESPVLVLSEPMIGDVDASLDWELTPTVYSVEFVEAYNDAAGERGFRAPVHLKLDTGMHRVGAHPMLAFDVARAIQESANLRFDGLFTHMPVADEDPEFSRTQVEALVGFKDALGLEGIRPEILHAANSAATLTMPESRLDMVRCGIAVYGLKPHPSLAIDVELKPAMRVVSQVASTRRLPTGARPSYGRIRPMPSQGTVATVPIGYADGVPRRLSSTGGGVLIGGKRYPLAGTVTMDQLVVDVGNDDIEVGDEVVILGTSGEESISADDWAARLGTINYEVVCGFGPRLPRRYLR
ncbi:MAG: alanine racemase [Acidimicrobiia bacterium]|nr:alanine racemase [Acidimicrobiia bacterium]